MHSPRGAQILRAENALRTTSLIMWRRLQRHERRECTASWWL